MHRAAGGSEVTSPGAPGPGRWRLALQLMGSVVLAWHTLAMLIGPAPPSFVARAVYPAFKPYLRALDLDHAWAFFAPDPGRGRLLRYALLGPGGARQEHPLTEALRPIDPAYLRWTTLFTALDDDLPHHLRAAADLLCRRHQAQAPQAIEFIERRQLAITPESFLAGHRPLDEDYVTVRALAPLPCPK